MAKKPVQVREHERSAPSSKVKKARQPRTGVEILSTHPHERGGDAKGVDIHSVNDRKGEPDYQRIPESRRVTREEFAKTKKLEDDEHSA
jgi:hypothetical protein